MGPLKWQELATNACQTHDLCKQTNGSPKISLILTDVDLNIKMNIFSSQFINNNEKNIFKKYNLLFQPVSQTTNYLTNEENVEVLPVQIFSRKISRELHVINNLLILILPWTGFRENQRPRHDDSFEDGATDKKAIIKVRE